MCYFTQQVGTPVEVEIPREPYLEVVVLHFSPHQRRSADPDLPSVVQIVASSCCLSA